MVYEEIPDHLSTKPKTDNLPLATNVAYHPVQPSENTAAASFPQAQNQPDEEKDYAM